MSKIGKINSIGHSESAVGTNSVVQQQAQTPSLFWGQQVKAEAEAKSRNIDNDLSAKDIKNIEFLQKILNKTYDKYYIDHDAQGKHLCFKDKPNKNTKIEIYRIIDNTGNPTGEYYYIINGTTYDKGDPCYEEINRLMDEITEKCEVNY